MNRKAPAPMTATASCATGGSPGSPSAGPASAWHREHVQFARLLDFLDDRMADFQSGGEPDYGLLRDAVCYLTQYADRFHHPREDAAFFRLAERDAGMLAPVRELLQEHRVIAFIGDRLLRMLEDAVSDAAIERDLLEAVASTFLVYYRHHLSREEAEILPRVARLLTAEDWAQVAAAVPVAADPLFSDEVEARFRDLRRLLETAQE